MNKLKLSIVLSLVAIIAVMVSCSSAHDVELEKKLQGTWENIIQSKAQTKTTFVLEANNTFKAIIENTDDDQLLAQCTYNGNWSADNSTLKLNIDEKSVTFTSPEENSLFLAVYKPTVEMVFKKFKYKQTFKLIDIKNDSFEVKEDSKNAATQKFNRVN